MRNIIITTSLLLLLCKANGQQTPSNPFPKTITVTGSAEMEVDPDEIYVNVVLKEYQKRGEDKKELETIKNDFMNACRTANIPDSIISIVSYTGYNSYYGLRKKKKTPDLYAGITYQVKFSTSKQMDDLVDKLDDEATQSFDISYTSHSKMTQFRRELKIQAVKAAKEKATYLTDAIGEKLGGAITVKEPEENTGYTVSNLSSQVQVNANYRSSAVYDKSVDIDFKKIKIRYKVDVVFALQ